MKLNVKYRSNSQYKRVLGAALSNPLFDKQFFYGLSDQDKVNYAYGLAAVGGLDKFKQDDFNIDEYNRLNQNDKKAAWNYLAYKAFEDKNEETNTMFAQINEHFARMEHKETLTERQKRWEGVGTDIKGIGYYVLNKVDQVIDFIPNIIYTFGSLFSDMDGWKKFIQEDQWSSWMSEGKSIDELQYENKLDRWYLTDRYHSLEDAIDGFNLFGAPSWGNVIDFVGGVAGSIVDMSVFMLNGHLPGIWSSLGSGVYWSLMASETMEENTYLDNRALALVKTIGSVGLEAISESLFASGFGEPGLINTSIFYKSITDVKKRFLASLLTNAITEGLEEMAADVLDALFNLTLSGILEKTPLSVGDRESITNPDIKTWFEQVLSSGLSGALIGISGQISRLTTTRKGTIYTVDKQEVTMSRLTMWALQDMMSLMDGRNISGQENTQRVIEQMRKNKPNITDNEIKQSKAYKKALEADQASQQSVIDTVGYMKEALDRLGIDIGSFDANYRNAFTQALHYLTNYELNYREKLSKRQQAKQDAKYGERPTEFTDIRKTTQKWLDIFNTYGKGGRVIATRVIDSSDVNEQLKKQAVIGGYDAIVVVDMGTIDGAKPSLLVPIGNTLFVDAKQYEGNLGSRSEFLLTSIANNIVINIFASGEDKTNFFSIIAKAVLPTAYHDQTYSQFINDKGGLEAANVFLVKALLTNPQIMKIVFGDGKVKGFDAFVSAWNKAITLNRIILSSKEAEDVREYNHIIATVSKNMLDGLLGELKQINPELFANLQGLVESTPLKERVQLISKLIKSHSKNITDNSSSLVSLFMRDMGFTETGIETIKVEKDKKLIDKNIKVIRLKQSVADWFYQSGILSYAEARSMEGGYDSVKTPINAEDMTMELIFKTIIEHPALQYHLGINDPDFRDRFIAHLKNVIETKTLSVKVVSEYLSILNNFIRGITMYSYNVKDQVDAYNLMVDVKKNLQEARPDDFKFDEKALQTVEETIDDPNYQKDLKEFETKSDKQRDKTITKISQRNKQQRFSEMTLDLDLPDSLIKAVEWYRDNFMSSGLRDTIRTTYASLLTLSERLKELKKDNRTLSTATLIQIQHLLNQIPSLIQEKGEELSIVDLKNYINDLYNLVMYDTEQEGATTVAPEKKIIKYLPQRDIQGLDLTIPLAIQINNTADFQLNYKLMESLSTMFPTLYNQIKQQVNGVNEIYNSLAWYLYSKEKGIGVRGDIIEKGKGLLYIDVLSAFGITTDLLNGNPANGNQIATDITRRQAIFLAHLLFDGHINKGVKLLQTYSRHLKKATPETVAFLNTKVPAELVEAFAKSGMTQKGGVRGFDIINNALSQATGYVPVDLGLNGTAYVVMIDYSSTLLPKYSEVNDTNLTEYFKLRDVYIDGDPLPKYTKMDVLSANIYHYLQTGKRIPLHEIIDIGKVISLTKADLERRGADKKTVEDTINNLRSLQWVMVNLDLDHTSSFFNYFKNNITIGSGQASNLRHTLGITLLHEVSHAIGIYAQPGFYKQLDSQTLRSIRAFYIEVQNKEWVEEKTYDSEALQVEALAKVLTTSAGLRFSEIVRFRAWNEYMVSSNSTVRVLDGVLTVLTNILSLDTADLTKKGISDYLINELAKQEGTIVERISDVGDDGWNLTLAGQLSDILKNKTVEQIGDLLTHVLSIHALLKTDLNAIQNGYERDLGYILGRGDIEQLLSYYISEYIYTNALTEIVARTRRADVLIPLLSGLGDPIASNIKDPTFIGHAQDLKRTGITSPYKIPQTSIITESKATESFTVQQEWKGDNYTLYNEDVFNIIPRLLREGTKVDSIITDPPYNIGKTFTTKKGAEYDSRDSIDLHKYIVESAKLLKNRGVFATFINFAQLEIVKQAFQEAGIVFVKEVVWEKTNRPGVGQTDERIIIGQKVSRGQRSDLKVQVDKLEFNRATTILKRDSKNLTAKPYALLSQLITMLTKKGDVVFDGTAGGANIGIVALENGRKYIGSEIDYKQARHSSYRLGWQESGRLDTSNYSKTVPSMPSTFDIVKAQSDPKLQRYTPILVELNEIYTALSKNIEGNKVKYDVINAVYGLINGLTTEADFINYMNHIILVTNGKIADYFNTVEKINDKILDGVLYETNVALPTKEEYASLKAPFVRRAIDLLPIWQNQLVNGLDTSPQALSNFNQFVEKLKQAIPQGDRAVIGVLNLLVRGASIKSIYDAFNLHYNSPSRIKDLQVGDPVDVNGKAEVFLKWKSTDTAETMTTDREIVLRHISGLKLIDFAIKETKKDEPLPDLKEIKAKTKRETPIEPQEDKGKTITKKIKVKKDTVIKKDLVKKLRQDYELYNIPVYKKGDRILNTDLFNRYYVGQIISTNDVNKHGLVAEVISEPKMIDKKTMERGVVKIYLHSGLKSKYEVNIRNYFILDITETDLDAGQYAVAIKIAKRLDTIQSRLLTRRPTNLITSEELRDTYNDLVERYNDLPYADVKTYEELQAFLLQYENEINELDRDVANYNVEFDKIKKALSKEKALRLQEADQKERDQKRQEYLEQLQLKKDAIQTEREYRENERKEREQDEAEKRERTVQDIDHNAKTQMYMAILKNLIDKKITTIEQFREQFILDGKYNIDLITEFWGLFNPHGNAARYRDVLQDAVGKEFFLQIRSEIMNLRSGERIGQQRDTQRQLVLVGIGKALREINLNELHAHTEGVALLVDIYTQKVIDLIEDWYVAYEKFYAQNQDVFEKDLDTIFAMIKHPTDYIQGIYDAQGNLSEYAIHVLNSLLKVLPDLEVSINEFFPEKIEMPKTTTLFEIPPVEEGQIFLPLSKPNEKIQEVIKNSTHFDHIVGKNEKTNAMTILDKVLRFQGISIEESQAYTDGGEDFVYAQSLEREFHDAFDHHLKDLSGTAWSAIFATLIDLNNQGLLGGSMANALQLISYYKALVDSGQGIMATWRKVDSAITIPAISKAGQILSQGKKRKNRYHSLTNTTTNGVEKYLYSLRQYYMDTLGLSYKDAHKKAKDELSGFTFNLINESRSLSNINAIIQMVEESSYFGIAPQESDDARLQAANLSLERLELIRKITNGEVLEVEDIQTLWDIAQSEQNYEVLMLLQKYLQDKAKTTLKEMTSFKDLFSKDRSKRLAAWELAGRKIRAFRFIAMLSNPSVPIKAFMQTNLNSWVDRGVVNPITNKILTALNKKGLGEKLQIKNGNSYIYDSVTNKYYNYIFSKEQKVWRLESTTSHRALARTYSNTQINGVIDHATNEIVIKGLKDVIEATPKTKNRLSIRAATEQYNLAKGGQATQNAVNFVDEVFVKSKLLEFIQENSKMRYLGDDVIDAYIRRANPFVSKPFILLYNGLYRFLEEPKRKVVQKQMTWYLQNLVESNKTYELKQVVDAEMKEALEAGDHKRIAELEETFKEEVSKLATMAYLQSLEVVFKSSNAIFKFLGDIGRTHPLVKFFLDAVVPFPRVSSNVLIQIFKHSPFGLVKTIVNLAKLKHGNLEANLKTAEGNMVLYNLAKDGAKGILGSAMYLIGFVLGVLGFVKLDEEKKYRGFTLDIGGLKIDISNVSMLAPPLLLGASLSSITDWGNGGLKNAANGWLEQFSTLTFLGNLVETFQYYDATDGVLRFFDSYFTSYFPAILKSLFKVISPEVKDYSAANHLQKMLYTTMPFLAPNKKDPYSGEDMLRYEIPVLYDILNMISPVAIYKYPTTDVQEISKEYGVSLLPYSDREMGFDDTKGVLSKDDRALYNETRGRAYNQLVNEIVNSTEWEKASTEERTSMLSSARTKATATAKVALWLSRSPNNRYNYVGDSNTIIFVKSFLQDIRINQVKKLLSGYSYIGSW